MFWLLVMLGLGFLFGRIYQWAKAAHVVDTARDPRLAAHHAMSDLAAQTRRTEEQLQRLNQWRPRGR